MMGLEPKVDPKEVKEASRKARARTKGKRKNKGAQGACFACGQMGHGIANCPDRHAPQGKSMSPSSKGFSKGKGKSKKGKGKGKTYYVEYEYIPDGVNEINVLSLVENEDLDTMATSWVVLDTGATESVARVNSMTRIMQTYDDRDYRITLHERPTFRFGNGMTQRAISRIHLKSKALGEVAFYLLDGTASNTPPLLGSKDMRERKAVISYTMNYMAHQNAWTGQWWLSDLRSLPAGHLLLDLQRPCKPLFRALRDLQVPFNAFGGGGNDDHDDDDDHDGGNGPAGAYGGPGKRSRSGRNDQNEISRLVEITALAAERADDPLPSPSLGRDEELDEAEVEGEVPDLPPEEPLLGATLDSQETMEHPEDETSHHNDADDRAVSSESCEVLRVRRPFNDEASRSKDSRSSERPLNDSDFEESVNMVWHASDSPWSEHRHGDEPRLSDRLSILAQRLQGLQQRLRDDERQAMPTFDRPGSKADGMAMRGQSLPREGEIEQGGNLAVMHSMRSTTEVRDQEHPHRVQPGNWTTSGSGGDGPDRAAGDLPWKPDDREGVQRQADGASWTNPGGDRRSGKDICPSESGREAGGGNDGISGMSRTTAPREEETGISKSQSNDANTNRQGNYADSNDEGKIFSNDTTKDNISGKKLNAISAGESREEREGQGDASVPTSGISADNQRFGRGSGGSGMSALWNALGSLRARMSGKCHQQDGTQSLQPSTLTSTRNPNFEEQATSLPTTRTTNTTTRPSPLKNSDYVTEEVYAVDQAMEKPIRPSMARRLATAAALTASLMMPVQELVQSCHMWM